MNNPREICSTRHKEENVHMVRHHAPGIEFVTLTIEVFQRRGDEGAMLAKDCRARPGVEELIQPVAEDAIDFCAFRGRRCLPQGTFAFTCEQDRGLPR
jgi:hypothetical protein